MRSQAIDRMLELLNSQEQEVYKMIGEDDQQIGQESGSAAEAGNMEPKVVDVRIVMKIFAELCKEIGDLKNANPERNQPQIEKKVMIGSIRRVNEKVEEIERKVEKLGNAEHEGSSCVYGLSL